MAANLIGIQTGQELEKLEEELKQMQENCEKEKSLK